MANSHHISASERLTRMRVWGPPDARFAIRAIEELAKDPKFHPQFNVLVDARDLDDGDSPLNQIEDVVDALRALRTSYEGKVAIIARIGGPHFALLNLMCAYAGSHGLRIRAFTAHGPAENWLAED